MSQDDFPTGHGELRRWLREQIDGCEGLIQLVGDAYGAEPTEVDPDYGRVSYTQLEFLYAGRRDKKTWVIVIGDECRRDKPHERLDLPREAAHPDPAGYQAERRALQQNYLARLKRDNHLRHSEHNDTELQNIVLRLRDELGELRQHDERRLRRLAGAIIAILFGLAVLGGSGWWAYQRLHADVQQAAVVTTEKIRAHLLQTTAETHRRELAEADAATGWEDRERLREAAEAAQAIRLSRIEDLATSFAEIEGRGTATSVFQEMTRILAEEGVDAAIAYVATRRPSILETVRARAAAALHEAKGQPTEACALYADTLTAEPDWAEALHAAFWFLADQGDLARVRTTLADARRDYEHAHRLAQRLTAGDPSNTEWQRDLWVSYWRLADLAERQNKAEEARGFWMRAFAVLSDIKNRGLHLSPEDQQWLEVLRQRVDAAAPSRPSPPL